MPDAKLTGWSRVAIPATLGVDPRMQWRVDTEKKLLICSGEGGHEWLKLDKEFADFELHVEWRFVPKPGEPRYNSGIGVRMSPWGEIWLQAQTGQAGAWLFGNTFGDGGMKRVNLSKETKENRIKPVGEWNRYEITAKGDTITLAVNGGVVNTLSGMSVRRGIIGLEGEGFEIEFRTIRLRTLD